MEIENADENDPLCGGVPFDNFDEADLQEEEENADELAKL